jgi:uncharacterized protein (DUF2164 family)
MRLELDPVRRERIAARLQKQASADFDISLSAFQAGEVVDLMLKTLGPEVYNQAVQDVRAHFQTRLDDLDGEVYADGEL